MSNQLPLSCKILKELRQSNHYTQKYVAQKIGVEVKTYRSWEIGYYKENVQIFPTIDSDKLIKISNLYNVSIDYILGQSEITQVDNTYIHNKIGLSENSIDVLEENMQQRNRLYRNRYIEMIDFLLSHAETKTLLQNMYYYFFGNYKKVWDGKSEPSDLSIDIYDDLFCDAVSVESDKLFVIFLSSIINALPTIKKNIVDNNPIYKNYGKQIDTIETLEEKIKFMKNFFASTNSNGESDRTFQIMCKQLEALKKTKRK